MKFYLVDQIESFEPGKKIVTTKCLTAAEEYLADHFPTFPVMPGVMMLEACVQSAAFVVREALDWSVGMVVLQRARNVRYANFVVPGDTLRIEAELLKQTEDAFSFKCRGTVGGETAVQARIDVRPVRLADENPAMARADAEIIAQMAERARLCGGSASLDGPSSA